MNKTRTTGLLHVICNCGVINLLVMTSACVVGCAHGNFSRPVGRPEECQGTGGKVQPRPDIVACFVFTCLYVVQQMLHKFHNS